MQRRGRNGGETGSGSCLTNTICCRDARASEIGGIASNSWWRGGLVSFRQGKIPVQRGVEGGRCARCRTSPPHEAPAVRRGRRGASRRRVRDGAVAALCSEHNAAVAARVEVAAVGLGSRSGRGVVKRGRLGSRRVGPRRGARRRSRRDGRARDAGRIGS